MNMQAQLGGQFDQAMKPFQNGAIGKSPTIVDQIGRAHEQLDRLTGAIGCLDERLTPILSFAQPSPGSTGMNAVASEPPAIEELNRLLLRIQGLVSRVDDITERARV